MTEDEKFWLKGWASVIGGVVMIFLMLPWIMLWLAPILDWYWKWVLQ